MSIEVYIRETRVTSFKLCDDDSILVPINECNGFSTDEIMHLLNKENIEIHSSEDKSVSSMKFVGDSAIDALLLIQMNLNDNFEELITNSKEMEFYEISSLTRSYQNSSDRITAAIDKIKYKNGLSEFFAIKVKPENQKYKN